MLNKSIQGEVFIFYCTFIFSFVSRISFSATKSTYMRYHFTYIIQKSGFSVVIHFCSCLLVKRILFFRIKRNRNGSISMEKSCGEEGGIVILEKECECFTWKFGLIIKLIYPKLWLKLLSFLCLTNISRRNSLECFSQRDLLVVLKSLN